MLAGHLLRHRAFRVILLLLDAGICGDVYVLGGLAMTREPRPGDQAAHDTRNLPPATAGAGAARPQLCPFPDCPHDAVLGTMAMSFAIVCGAQRFTLTGTQVGGLTATIAVVQVVMFPVGAWLPTLRTQGGAERMRRAMALAVTLAGWAPGLWGCIWHSGW